ncbi:protein mono-ADP-ribosyltransferase PARP12b [Thalassophryne amazonica]|uniref:protein mono-ADP-ribosyltransferase PARP12b n=1 Tax=Thalassophryne amazonica TaxID=390379 RepID=UPI001470F11F|nr:protein mono-ADP-ribosyltransferase PARP12b [Thalassophryne amazonica]
MNSVQIQFATRLLCSNGGSMSLVQFHQNLLQNFSISDPDFLLTVDQCSRFLVVDGDRVEDGTVVAQTSLRLCSKYCNEECSGSGCQDLHLCRYFVYGTCRYSKARKPCKFSHDIHSDHNYPLLRECTLDNLNESELFLLLLQNDTTLLPQLCCHYNKGSGPYGDCRFLEKCTKLHLCKHFAHGECLFGHKCKRHHTIDEEVRLMLQGRGLSGDIIPHLPTIYQNNHHLHADSALSEMSLDSVFKLSQSDDLDQICLHFFLKTCKFQENCTRVHFHLPYLWEVFDGDMWMILQDMEDVERAFCDPCNTRSSGPWPVDFITMTQDGRPVRRLSTISSVTKPLHYRLTTEWRWFYQSSGGNWVEYGEPDEHQRTTSVSSRLLEEAYQANRRAEVKVIKGNKEYLVCFTDMRQRNLRQNTKRKIRRRPRFFSATDVEKQVAQ